MLIPEPAISFNTLVHVLRATVVTASRKLSARSKARSNPAMTGNFDYLWASPSTDHQPDAVGEIGNGWDNGCSGWARHPLHAQRLQNPLPVA